MKVLDKQIQEALDYAVMKIVQQGGMAITPSSVTNGCVYSDGKGRHCAIGWLLDRYNPNLMGFVGSVGALCNEFPEEVPYFIEQNLSLFTLLQMFHDDLSKRSREYRLERLRTEFNVDTSKSHWRQWVDMGGD